MARYPGAHWRPLGPQSEPRLRRKNIVCLHTMVGSLGGVDSYFRQNGYSGVESHFGVGHDGTVYQWQDTSHQADAQAEGNDNCISIETADRGRGFPQWSGSNVPAWTHAQVEAIVELVDWLCATHDIPRRLVPDSGDRRHGIGYHRQGVDPWRVPGGEHWSSSYGKVCPGERRIRQLREVVIPRVRGEEDEMGWHDEYPVWGPDRNPEGTMPGWQMVQQAQGYSDDAYQRVRDVESKVDGLVKALRAMSSGMDETIRDAVHDALADVSVSISYETEEES